MDEKGAVRKRCRNKIIKYGRLFMRKYLFVTVTILLLLSMGCKKSTLNVDNIRKGDSITFGVGVVPNSLNMYIDYNSFSIIIFDMLYQTLLTRDLNTLEIKGELAKSWKISPDKMKYTFYLNKDAKWADGTPVTSEDVIFTYETIMNPNNLTSLFRAGFEDAFEKVYAVDEYTVVFKTKTKRWSNFIDAFSLVVLPKKEFEGKDFNKDFNLNLPMGSGPYKIKEIVTDRFITIEKRKEYWGENLENNRYYNNFEEIKFKVINEDEIMFEALKKGDIDVMPGGTAAQWHNKVYAKPSKLVTQNWIVPKRIWNYSPVSKQFFYMNLRREKFQDIRVRKAMNMLLNFKLLQEKIMYKQYEKIKSFFPGFYKIESELEDYDYNPEKARILLTEAGWNSVDSDGILKNSKGERFEIDFVYRDQSLEKHLTVYKEDLQKVGIKLNLNLIATSAYRKKCFIDYDYDMTWIAWGSTLFPGIEDGWRSKFADEKNSNNVAGYKNSEIDKLLDIYLEEFDEAKRVEIMKKIDNLLLQDVPVVLLWTAPYVRLLYWNKFDTTPTYLEKYNDSDTIYKIWSIDTEKEENLIDAIINNIALPTSEVDYYYSPALIQK